MPRVTVWLDYPQVEALKAAAIADRRRPADQAAIILAKNLATKSATPIEKTKEAHL